MDGVIEEDIDDVDILYIFFLYRKGNIILVYRLNSTRAHTQNDNWVQRMSFIYVFIECTK